MFREPAGTTADAQEPPLRVFQAAFRFLVNAPVCDRNPVMHYNRLPSFIAVAFAMLTLGSLVIAQHLNPPEKAGGGHLAAGEMRIHTPASIVWKDGPPSLPRGARFAVLEGDPAKEGPFTMRLLVPAGYRIPPHWHPKTERVTVISGTFNMGMGETFRTEGGNRMTAGSYGYWDAGMRHFAWSEGETVVQLHGIGPWQINYVNPTDDPRTAQK